VKRVQRLDIVQRVTEQAERERAEALARAEQHVNECEMKLADLQRYRTDYEQSFQRGGGGDVIRLRDFQVFLARLSEAINQQRTLLTQAEARRASEYTRWQEAAQRTRAIGTLTERWLTEERRVSERTEQRESDERALRSSANANREVSE
jgi:flagellar FliJ protein